jgi:hypothetical protein
VREFEIFGIDQRLKELIKSKESEYGYEVLDTLAVLLLETPVPREELLLAIYHDWILANKTAEFTEGSMIAIGNTAFRQTQFRGNDMPTLRKRIGKWSYGRQRVFIALKRAERGYPTKLRRERNTSRECHCCGSLLTARKWSDGSSYILCHSCDAKEDADINAAYNIAFRCQDDWLKAQMTMTKSWGQGVSASPRL